jgi:hypothetical protein
VLAEDLVVEALYAERDLVALVLRRLDRVGRIGRILDRVFRRSRGRSGCFAGGRLIRCCLLPAPIREDGDGGGGPQ